MQVHILPFGVLRDYLGPASSVELPAGATVGSLIHLLSSEAIPASIWSSIAVSVNATYAQVGHVLCEGDEVGLLPPVSGGTSSVPDGADELAGVPPVLVKLTREAIAAVDLVASAKHAEDGAVVVFDGIVRNHSRGRRTTYLDYEAYDEMALKQMNELAHQARDRFGVRHVTILHRLGRLAVGETSVLIVVASAHRAQAYAASRWLIDTLKKTVPIWKKETFVDGSVWADGEPFPEGIPVARPEVADGSH